MTVGMEMHAFLRELYPVCRSITGNGLRETLGSIGHKIPLKLHEIPSGARLFDWRVPQEWNIRDAYVKDSRGRRVIDFRKHNLHVVNYSVPVRATLSLAELKPHLHSLPNHPSWIPYKTSYYQPSWGFCVPHKVVESLRQDRFEVCIDSSLADGSLTYAECRLPGTTNEEVLIYTHACHPSLANDNLSGIAVATFLARTLQNRPRRLTYRFVFAPGLIGALAWLARNRRSLHRLRYGLVLSGVGDAGQFTYKQSRQGNSLIDRVVAHVLRQSGEPHEIRPFTPYGYDERQFCSPGFNLPVGCLMRTPFDEYPEYHTSADNPEFVEPSSLAGALEVCQHVVALIEANVTYRNLLPFGEPQLGKRGLYTSVHHRDAAKPDPMAVLWMLNLTDGTHSLLDIAERSRCDVNLLDQAASVLAEAGLLEPLQRKSH